MKIALAGPIDVTAFAEYVVGGKRIRRGYSYPLTTSLGLAYVRAGHDLVIFAMDEQVHEPQEHRGERCAIHVLPRRADYRARGRDMFGKERALLRDAMRSESPHATHAHWTYEFALAALEVAPASTLVTVHDWAPAIMLRQPDPYRASRFMMQFRTLLRSQHLSAPSPYIADRVRRLYRKPVSVVPNGVTIPEYSPRVGRRAPTIGALNVDFGSRKNVQTLLHAFRRIRARIPTAVCRLAGPPFSPEGEAHGWARAQGLDHGVDWVGPLDADQVPPFLASLSLFVHPSLEESFGLALVEAMALGVPVLGGRSSGAVPWVVGKGRTANVRDSEELAGAIANRLTAEDFLESESLRVYEEARRRFDIEQIARDYLDLLSLVAK